MLHSSFGRRPLVLATSLLAALAIVALAFTPAVSDQMRPFLQYFGIVSCSSSSPCAQYSNSGNGAGIEGVTKKGNGLVGQTRATSTPSPSAIVAHAGVLGQDLSTGGWDSGIEGTSTLGEGVFGSSTQGPGILGASTNGSGVYGQSTNGVGVLGYTSHNSTTAGFGSEAITGHDLSSDGGHLNSGVYGYSGNGVGVTAQSTNWIGANVTGGVFNVKPLVPALSIVSTTGGDLIDGCAPSTVDPCDSSHRVFDVDSIGDVRASSITVFGSNNELCDINGSLDCQGTVFAAQCLQAGTSDCPGNGYVNITGQYQVSGACAAGCAVATATHPGRAVVSYVATQSLPSIDDFGEAILKDGYAYVRIDVAFANVIDRTADYLVFITPEGDSRGLYVTRKTAEGFVVRENMGGHSSLAFSYRILAKPLGTQEQRLPMVALPQLRSPHHMGTITPGKIR